MCTCVWLFIILCRCSDCWRLSRKRFKRYWLWPLWRYYPRILWVLMKPAVQCSMHCSDWNRILQGASDTLLLRWRTQWEHEYKKLVPRYQKYPLVLCLKRMWFHSTWKHFIAICGSARDLTARVRVANTEQCRVTTQEKCVWQSLCRGF